MAVSRVPAMGEVPGLSPCCRPAAAVAHRVSSRSNLTAARAGKKHAYSPSDALNLELGGRADEPRRGASGSGTEGRPPIFGSPPHGLPCSPTYGLPWSIPPGCALWATCCACCSRWSAGGIRTLPHASPRRSRGLATSQTMDGSPSLRRRHRAAVRSSWAGFLHTRPLMCPFVQNRFRSQKPQS